MTEITAWRDACSEYRILIEFRKVTYEVDTIEFAVLRHFYVSIVDSKHESKYSIWRQGCTHSCQHESIAIIDTYHMIGR